MTARKKKALWIILVLGIVTTVAIVFFYRRQPVTLRGAVVQGDLDPNKQLPLGGVEITAINSLGSGSTQSNSSGFFRLTLPKGLRLRQSVVLQFRHKDYQPLDLTDLIGDKLYIARMVPLHQAAPTTDSHPQSLIANTRIRYSVKATTEANIGSAVRTFEVVNTGNTPCSNRPPCSSNGKWKASIGSLSLDAGEGNEFRNARASCIAGPCPFTKIEEENLSPDRRHFNVSALNWSDTTTLLLEAEVVHPMTSDIVRETYPVIFGRALNFSLPASAEGPSITAEVDGEPIVFPLGPDLILRWADCQMQGDKDQSKNYRCELKRGYQFR
jgi:hypothetical protein